MCENLMKMQKYLSRLIQLFRKEEKPRSKAGYWLLPIGVFIVGGVGYLLTESTLFAADIGEIVPARNLTFYADLGSPDCTPQFRAHLPKLCDQKQRLLSTLTGNIPQRIALFSDRLAAVHYADLTGTLRDFSPTLFLRVTNPKQAETFIKNLDGAASATEENQQGTRIIHFQEPYARTVFFWKGWLVFSPQPDFPKLLADVKNGTSIAANNDAFLRGLAEKLPTGDLRLFMKSKILSHLLPVGAAPLLDFVPEIGITIREEPSKIGITIATATPNTIFDQNRTGNEAMITSLVASLPTDDPLLLTTIRSPQQEIDWALSSLEKTDPAFAFFIRGQARQFLESLFGKGISLDTDILPLLENEFMLALYRNPAGNGFSPLLAVDTEDRTFAEQKKGKLLAALQHAAANFVPRILEHVLEDGEVIREVAACDDCVQTEEEAVQEAELSTFVSEDQSGSRRSVSMGLLRDIFVFSTEKEKAKYFLQRLQEDTTAGNSLNTKFPAIDSHEEFLYLKPEILIPFFPGIQGSLGNLSEIYAYREFGLPYFNVQIDVHFPEAHQKE